MPTARNMKNAVVTAKIVDLLHKETKGPTDGIDALSMAVAYITDVEQKGSAETAREDKVKSLALFMLLLLTYFGKHEIKLDEVYDAAVGFGTHQ